jgi:hypothetical protein
MGFWSQVMGIVNVEWSSPREIIIWARDAAVVNDARMMADVRLVSPRADRVNGFYG